MTAQLESMLMKYCLTLVSLLSALLVSAQNYDCLHPDEQPWFTNGDGYLRGMRIDSTVTEDLHTVYYPYRTARALAGNFHYGFELDSNGGSWLGKRVVAQPDGIWQFDNLWGDTILIKTAAILGESWLFYDDTSTYTYTAILVSVDTATILGTLDSVKKIVIQADSGGVYNPADLVQGWTILLSKNHGFVQVFDLYTFPYHKANGRWNKGTDYFIEMMHGVLAVGDEAPPEINYIDLDSSKLNFHRVDFHDPTYKELYDFEVGDIFEYKNVDNYDYYSSINFSYSLRIDTITAKTETPEAVTYTYNFQMGSQHVIAGPSGSSTTYGAPNFGGASLVYDNSLLFNLYKMPEEWNAPYSYYTFLPAAGDGTPCDKALYSKHTVTVELAATSFPANVQVDNYQRYATGFGLIDDHYQSYYFGFSEHLQTKQMIYASKSGTVCFGSMIAANLGVEKVPYSQTRLTLSPNPAKDELRVHLSFPAAAGTAFITDMIGQILVTASFYQGNVTLPTVALSNGFYVCTVNFSDGSRSSLPFVVQH